MPVAEVPRVRAPPVRCGVLRAGARGSAEVPRDCIRLGHRPGGAERRRRVRAPRSGSQGCDRAGQVASAGGSSRGPRSWKVHRRRGASGRLRLHFPFLSKIPPCPPPPPPGGTSPHPRGGPARPSPPPGPPSQTPTRSGFSCAASVSTSVGSNAAATHFLTRCTASTIRPRRRSRRPPRRRQPPPRMAMQDPHPWLSRWMSRSSPPRMAMAAATQPPQSRRLRLHRPLRPRPRPIALTTCWPASRSTPGPTRRRAVLRSRSLPLPKSPASSPRRRRARPRVRLLHPPPLPLLRPPHSLRRSHRPAAAPQQPLRAWSGSLSA